MTNSIQLFTQDNSAITYQNKKGDSFHITTEGALFKGGQAITALKDAAMLSAYHKAEAGRYRAAADILGAAFPAMTKAFEKFMGVETWASKTTMGLYLDKLEALRPTNEVKGFSTKQVKARQFIDQLRTIKALESVTANAFIVEA